MSTTNLNTPLPANPLDRITLSSFDRLRAEAAIRRGEYLAELMLDGIAAVRALFGSAKLKPRVDAAHRLGPTA
jgi:hypothetical protein